MKARQNQADELFSSMRSVFEHLDVPSSKYSLSELSYHAALGTTLRDAAPRGITKSFGAEEQKVDLSCSSLTRCCGTEKSFRLGRIMVSPGSVPGRLLADSKVPP